MRRHTPIAPLLAVAALLVAGCGTKGVDVPENESASIKQGAEIFYNRCAGCHTLDVGGSEGSAVDPNSREYKDGPNFNQRLEEVDQVLYAIRNGGYSSGPMPQNIVVGEEARAVAEFVAKYSGREASRAPVTGQRDNPQGQRGGENPVPTNP
jgi:mono/diheme cytochrome c family protein